MSTQTMAVAGGLSLPMAKSTMVTIGGMAGGLVEAHLLQPLDYLKTRLQMGGNGPQTGLVQLTRQVVQSEGVSALYRGLVPFSAQLVGKYGLRFAVNDKYKDLLRSSDGSLSRPAGFLSGILSGVTEATVLVTPLEVIKTRQQGQQRLSPLSAASSAASSVVKYRGLLQTGSVIVKEEGALALWSGLGATAFRQGFNQCFLFGMYPILRQAMWGSAEGRLPAHQTMITGMTAGMIGPFLTAPVDVAKTRLMMQTQTKAQTQTKQQRLLQQQGPKYTSTLQTMRVVVREEGVAALYRGLLPRVLRVAPGQGITFAVMESVMRLLSGGQH